MSIFKQFANRSVEEIIQFYTNRIQEHNEQLNIVIGDETIDLDQAIKRLQANPGGKLRGVPILIKDNISVEGWGVTCGSKILQGYKSPYHATVIERLVREGALPLARVNMDEFAFGSSCETSFYGPTRNPWNPETVPGGSSGGSAAGVAADFAPAALGSDTGGSIRQPASFCGVVGMKPTYGRVSRYGLVAFASSLDQIGPFTRTVEDAALLLEVIAGHDPKDSTSANVPVPEYSKTLGQSIKGLKIGLPKEFYAHAIDPSVTAGIERAKEIFKKAGAELVDISLPHTDYAVSVYYVVGPCEASSNLSRFDGIRFGRRAQQAEDLKSIYEMSRDEGFGKEAKRRILLGTFALSSGYYDAYYLKAMKTRRKIIEDFNQAFRQVDVILTPTAPTAAFKIGEKTSDPLSMYLSDIFTISANLAGVPGISVPCGMTPEGLPLGMQLMAKPFDEETMLRVAYCYEQQSGFAGQVAKNYQAVKA